jgi:hypothetical protein
MPSSGYPRVTFLGMALLLLFLPACSAPSALSGGSRALPEDQAVRVAAAAPPVAKVPPASSQPVNDTGLDKADKADKQHPPEPVHEDFGNAGDDTWARLHYDIDLCMADYRHYYSVPNLGCLALGFAVAAPLANTSADQSIRRWYQRRIRGETTDEYAQVMNYAGQFWVVLPIGLEVAVWAGMAEKDYAFDSGLWEWSNRSLRAMAVGAPPMLAMYVVLGSSRPDRNNSHWHPFQDIHGVSGHTFVGAVPFLTAAAMTDNPFYKYPLLFGSLLTGWARLDLDRHYFSQIVLGWWMAYAAVHSVNQTQAEKRSFTIGPTWLGDGPGVAACVQY